MSIAKAEHAKNLANLAKSENENKLATAAHSATEKMWSDSIAVLQKMGVEKASKDKECKDLKVELKKLDAKLLKDNQILSTESTKQKERTALLAIQKEAHQKIVADAKDSNYTQPLAAVVQKTKSLKALVGQSTEQVKKLQGCLLYTSPSPRDLSTSRMPSSA